jgi:CheY-like chemotaxis protein
MGTQGPTEQACYDSFTFMRALVAEDNALVLPALVGELRADYEVVAATTGEQAIAFIDDREFDLVVSDSDLGPGPSGDEVLARARVSRPDAARVLLVGAHKRGAPPPAGVDAHLVIAKPVPPGDLLAAVRRQRAGVGQPAEQRSEALFSRRRMVLVVDDSEDAQELVRHCLEPGGFYVTSVLSGREAIDRLSMAPTPGLLIVDLMMPEMNGMELIDALQSYRRLHSLPMLILSAVAVPPVARLPGVRYLQKPFRNDELLATVRELTGEA